MAVKIFTFPGIEPNLKVEVEKVEEDDGELEMWMFFCRALRLLPSRQRTSKVCFQDKLLSSSAYNFICALQTDTVIAAKGILYIFTNKGGIIRRHIYGELEYAENINPRSP